jgi:integrase/recombinase XerD
MKEELIIKVLDKASKVISQSQIMELRLILEEELYKYDLQPAITALVPINSMPEKIMIFLASKKLDGRAGTTIESYRRYLVQFSRFIQKEPQDINTMDVRMFLSTFVKKKVKNSTLATVIFVLKSFFAWLHAEEYIARNPMVKIQATKKDRNLRKALTHEELEMVRMACVTDRDRAMLEFLYSTGCRLDEVVKLNKDDIGWNDDSVKVLGKGSKERIVYLNAKAKVHVWRYLSSRKDIQEALFVSSKSPYDRIGDRGFEKVISALGKRAGLKQNVFPHLIRHTTATHMLQNGASLMEVQEYLGHDSPATTQIYAKLDREAVRISHKKHLAG